MLGRSRQSARVLIALVGALAGCGRSVRSDPPGLDAKMGGGSGVGGGSGATGGGGTGGGMTGGSAGAGADPGPPIKPEPLEPRDARHATVGLQASPSCLSSIAPAPG